MFQPVRRKPKWLGRALAAMRDGKSRAEAAAIAGVSRQTLHNVLRTLPDWSGVRPERIKA